MAEPTKKASVLKVEAALREAGFANEIVALTESARSAEEAAAGHTHAVFPCTPQELVTMTRGEISCLKG